MESQKISRKEEKALKIQKYCNNTFDEQVFINNLRVLLTANRIPKSLLANCIGTSSQTITNWIGGNNADKSLPRELELVYKLFTFLFNEIPYFNMQLLQDKTFDLDACKRLTY